MQARRYAPFAVLILAQLVLVGLAPSKPPLQSAGSFTEGGFSSGAPGLAPDGSVLTPGAPGAEGTTPGAVGGTNGAVTSGGSGTTAGGGSAGSSGGTGGATGAGVPGAPAKGDTSHCKAGRQFAGTLTPPPCVAKWTGGSNNGGATYRGVSAKTVKIVYFREKDNPVVKGLLQSQDLYSEPADQQRFLQAAETFLNKHYELFGRKVELSFYRSPCQAAPPDPTCFRTDAKNLVAQEKPFAVFYDNNTNTPAFFDELSQLGVINFGGWHFQDSFNTAHRPYHYDVYMGGDFQATLTGEYWCKKLAGKKAKFAGTPDLQAKVRKAVVSYPQTEVNVAPARRLQEIMRKCGTEVVDLPYSPDTTTAAQQSRSQIQKAKDSGATSYLYFADPIAPAFGTNQMTQQAWFPEHVLVGSGLIDYDKLARLYDQQQWVHAFGPSDLPNPDALGKSDAGVVWRDSGNSGTPYASANLPWSYLASLGCGIQMSGPTLNPGTFERALLGGSCDGRYRDQPKTTFVHFARGDYTAISDAREVYWDPNATSEIDGKAGAYIPLNKGRRYAIGEWPSGEPVLPGRS